MNRPNCPGCTAPMKPMQAGEVELDRCGFCKGLWFDGGELERVMGKKLVGALSSADVRARLCPKCNVQLVAVVLGAVQVDACGTCRGVFLDDGELMKLNGGKQVRVRADITPQPRNEIEVKDDVMAWLHQMGG